MTGIVNYQICQHARTPFYDTIARRRSAIDWLPSFVYTKTQVLSQAMLRPIGGLLQLVLKS